MTGVYLHLFHGRNAPDEQLDDWGFDGPTIGPLEYVHVTYMCDIKIAAHLDVIEEFFPEKFAEMKSWAGGRELSDVHPTDHHLPVVDGLVEHDGKFYGDFSVFVKEEA
ncbi:hypothetical protein KNJ79_05120 [Sphingopyxis indica]|uniref:hypothetical protein n=1 Tax=Sphingopyxis indica TaxID=436663 RepID=UPI00293946DC|nr:hypothetical protein [Sphingopyxis indica]WOF44313.1 hypothetical protein KNJ79_05120 [Sphingopyxis indica]